MKLLFLTAFLSFFGTKPSESGFTYRPLVWSDFRGPAPSGINSPAALTSCKIDLATSETAGVFHFDVQAYFLPRESFVRVRGASYLRHEQCHFQIACIAARRCMQEMEPLQGGDSTTERKANNIYQDYVSSWKSRNTLFDYETNHSLNEEAERRWEGMLSAEVAQLKIH